LTAATRRQDAAEPPLAPPDASEPHLWREAVKIRQEWLAHGLSTQPADRPTAEQSLSAIYASMRRPPPRFRWAESPYQALRLTAGRPTLDQLYTWTRNPRGVPPVASDLAMAASRLRGSLSAGVGHPDPELTSVYQPKGPKNPKGNLPWPELPPAQAFRAGVPTGVVLHQGIRTALHRSLFHGLCRPVRDALTGAGAGAGATAGGGPMPVCWYGQQDASWIGYYDALRRLGLARYGPGEAEHLARWAALARSCGWWWPGEEECVVLERPALIRTEPVPAAWHDEVRLAPGGVRYRDGWQPHLP
jgi:hypothetical protein